MLHCGDTLSPNRTRTVEAKNINNKKKASATYSWTLFVGSNNFFSLHVFIFSHRGERALYARVYVSLCVRARVCVRTRLHNMAAVRAMGTRHCCEVTEATAACQCVSGAYIYTRRVSHWQQPLHFTDTGAARTTPRYALHTLPQNHEYYRRFT